MHNSLHEKQTSKTSFWLKIPLLKKIL